MYHILSFSIKGNRPKEQSEWQSVVIEHNIKSSEKNTQRYEIVWDILSIFMILDFQNSPKTLSYQERKNLTCIGEYELICLQLQNVGMKGQGGNPLVKIGKELHWPKSFRLNSSFFIQHNFMITIVSMEITTKDKNTVSVCFFKSCCLPLCTADPCLVTIRPAGIWSFLSHYVM